MRSTSAAVPESGSGRVQAFPADADEGLSVCDHVWPVAWIHCDLSRVPHKPRAEQTLAQVGTGDGVGGGITSCLNFRIATQSQQAVGHCRLERIHGPLSGLL